MLHPANAYLGPRPLTDRSPIGVTVLDINRAEVTPWSAQGVTPTMPGWYAVAGGVDVPAAGGFIVWGTQRQPLAEEAIAPIPQLPTDTIVRGVQAALRELGNRMAALIPPPVAIPAPIVQMDTSPFVGAVAELHAALSTHTAQVHSQIVEMAGGLDAIRETAASLSYMDDIIRQKKALDALRQLIGAALGGGQERTQAQPVTIVNEIGGAGGTGKLESIVETLRADMARLNDEVSGAVGSAHAEEARRRTVAALDKFLAATEGQA